MVPPNMDGAWLTRLAQLRDNEQLSFSQIGSRLGITKDQARYYYQKAKGRSDPGRAELYSAEISEDAPATALEEWRALEEKPTWQELLEFAEKGQQLHDRMRPIIQRATRTIYTSGPVAVVFMSDFHLGARGTDYAAFVRTTDLIMSDPRFMVIVNGADLEGAFHQFRSAEPGESSVMPVWMQIEAFKLWVDTMLDRIICICGDNHVDERLERILGDIGLIWRDDLLYFRTFGLLKLCLQSAESSTDYTGLVTHRYKGHSIYHKLQPTLRTMRDIYPVADFYATAHTHTPAYMNGVYYPLAREEEMPEQHFVVSGSFKTRNDVYSLRNHGGSGILGLPTLVFWPDVHLIQYFKSPWVAQFAMGWTMQQQNGE